MKRKDKRNAIASRVHLCECTDTHTNKIFNAFLEITYLNIIPFDFIAEPIIRRKCDSQ